MPRRASPTDLTNAQWAILEPVVPAPKPGGRPAKHPRREIVNAMRPMLRGGGSWRLMPHEFPRWQTVKTTEQGGLVAMTAASRSTGARATS